MCFPESFEFETMNKQKQPEKKQFTTPSSLVVFFKIILTSQKSNQTYKINFPKKKTG